MSFCKEHPPEQAAVKRRAIERLQIYSCGGGPLCAKISETQTFTAIYTDPGGATDLQVVYLDIGGPGEAHSCFVAYVQAANQLYLFNDDDSAVSAPLTPGTAGMASNSQCTISGSGTTVSLAGNNLTVAFSFTFADTFTGLQDIYGLAQSYNGSQGVGWQSLGFWTP
ncbi:MAG: hypothetical protein ACREP9_19580 [Candidatus Dormibacteraceae bacterium]